MQISPQQQQQLLSTLQSHTDKPLGELSSADIEQLKQLPELQASATTAGIDLSQIDLATLLEQTAERGEAGQAAIDPQSEGNFSTTRPQKNTPFATALEAKSTFFGKVGKMHKKAKAFLTMAGLTHNADTAQVKRDVAEVAQRAAGSKEAIAQGVAEKTFLDMETCKNIASSILGLNQGPDQVVEARIKADNRDQLGNDTMFSLYAFDRADFQILNGLIYKPQDGVLHIEALRASHGRNCEDFKLGLGKPKEPGRGNSAIIAAGLESIILEGSKCGIHRITTKPGSFKVAELYQKMGFRVEGHTEKVDKPQAAELMYLDLTNTDRLKDALLGFSLSRSMITDVPKDVTARMLADGQEAPQPSYQQVKRRTRRAQVVRLEE